MAPLTRARSDHEGLPTFIVAEYCSQRASAGIISEATGISCEGLGWPNALGLWTDGPTEAWTPALAPV